MTWRFPPWDKDLTHDASKTEVPEAGGWLYQVRDPNGAYSTVFVPDLSAWSRAIGYGVVAAERAAIPIAIAPDLNRVRHMKQPIPPPKA